MAEYNTGVSANVSVGVNIKTTSDDATPRIEKLSKGTDSPIRFKADKSSVQQLAGEMNKQLNTVNQVAKAGEESVIKAATTNTEATTITANEAINAIKAANKELERSAELSEKAVNAAVNAEKERLRISKEQTREERRRERSLERQRKAAETKYLRSIDKSNLLKEGPSGLSLPYIRITDNAGKFTVTRDNMQDSGVMRQLVISEQEAIEVMASSEKSMKKYIDEGFEYNGKLYKWIQQISPGAMKERRLIMVPDVDKFRQTTGSMGVNEYLELGESSTKKAAARSGMPAATNHPMVNKNGEIVTPKVFMLDDASASAIKEVVGDIKTYKSGEFGRGVNGADLEQVITDGLTLMNTKYMKQIAGMDITKPHQLRGAGGFKSLGLPVDFETFVTENLVKTGIITPEVGQMMIEADMITFPSSVKEFNAVLKNANIDTSGMTPIEIAKAYSQAMNDHISNSARAGEFGWTEKGTSFDAKTSYTWTALKDKLSSDQVKEIEGKLIEDLMKKPEALLEALGISPNNSLWETIKNNPSIISSDKFKSALESTLGQATIKMNDNGEYVIKSTGKLGEISSGKINLGDAVTQAIVPDIMEAVVGGLNAMGLTEANPSDYRALKGKTISTYAFDAGEDIEIGRFPLQNVIAAKNTPTSIPGVDLSNVTMLSSEYLFQKLLSGADFDSDEAQIRKLINKNLEPLLDITPQLEKAVKKGKTLGADVAKASTDAIQGQKALGIATNVQSQLHTLMQTDAENREVFSRAADALSPIVSAGTDMPKNNIDIVAMQEQAIPFLREAADALGLAEKAGENFEGTYNDLMKFLGEQLGLSSEMLFHQTKKREGQYRYANENEVGQNYVDTIVETAIEKGVEESSVRLGYTSADITNAYTEEHGKFDEKARQKITGGPRTRANTWLDIPDSAAREGLKAAAELGLTETVSQIFSPTAQQIKAIDENGKTIWKTIDGLEQQLALGSEIIQNGQWNAKYAEGGEYLYDGNTYRVAYTRQNTQIPANADRLLELFDQGIEGDIRAFNTIAEILTSNKSGVIKFLEASGVTGEKMKQLLTNTESALHLPKGGLQTTGAQLEANLLAAPASLTSSSVDAISKIIARVFRNAGKFYNLTQNANAIPEVEGLVKSMNALVETTEVTVPALESAIVTNQNALQSNTQAANIQTKMLNTITNNQESVANTADFYESLFGEQYKKAGISTNSRTSAIESNKSGTIVGKNELSLQQDQRDALEDVTEAYETLYANEYKQGNAALRNEKLRSKQTENIQQSYNESVEDVIANYDELISNQKRQGKLALENERARQKQVQQQIKETENVKQQAETIVTTEEKATPAIEQKASQETIAASSTSKEEATGATKTNTGTTNNTKNQEQNKTKSSSAEKGFVQEDPKNAAKKAYDEARLQGKSVSEAIKLGWQAAKDFAKAVSEDTNASQRAREEAKQYLEDLNTEGTKTYKQLKKSLDDSKDVKNDKREEEKKQKEQTKEQEQEAKNKTKASELYEQAVNSVLKTASANQSTIWNTKAQKQNNYQKIYDQYVSAAEQLGQSPGTKAEMLLDASKKAAREGYAIESLRLWKEFQSMNGGSEGNTGWKSISSLSNAPKINIKESLSKWAKGGNFSKMMDYQMAYGYASSIFNSMYSSVKALDDELRVYQKLEPDWDKSELRAYSKELGALGTKYGKSIQEMTDASMLLTRSGYSGKEMKEINKGLTEQAVLLSNVSDEEYSVSESADSIVSVIKAWGIADEDSVGFAKKYIDAVNAVSNSFAVTSNDITDNIQTIASQAATAGMDVNETIALLTTGAEVSRNTGKTANASKTMMGRYIQQLDEGASTGKWLRQWNEEHGINWQDENGNIRDFYDYILDVSDIWDELSTNEKQLFEQKLGGSRQASNVANLMTNKETLIEAKATADKSAGSAAASNEVMMNSIEGSLSKLSAAWESFATATLNSDAIAGGLNALTAALNGLSNIPGLAQVAGTIVTTSTALLGLGLALNTFQFMVTTVGKVLAGISDAMLLGSALLSTIGPAIMAALPVLVPIIAVAAAAALVTGAVAIDKKIQADRNEARQQRIDDLKTNYDAVTESQNKAYSNLAKELNDYNTADFQEAFGDSYENLLKANHEFTEKEKQQLQELSDNAVNILEKNPETSAQAQSIKQLNKTISNFSTGLISTQNAINRQVDESLIYQEHYGLGAYDSEHPVTHRQEETGQVIDIESLTGISAQSLANARNERDQAYNLITNLERNGLTGTDAYTNAINDYNRAQTNYENKAQPVQDYVDSNYDNYIQTKENLELQGYDTFEEQVNRLNELGLNKTAREFENMNSAIETLTGSTGEAAEEAYTLSKMYEQDTENTEEEATVADIVSSQHGMIQQIASVASDYQAFKENLLDKENQYGQLYTPTWDEFGLSELGILENMFPNIEDSAYSEYIGAIVDAQSGGEVQDIYSDMLYDQLKAEFGDEGLAAMYDGENFVNNADDVLALRWKELGFDDADAILAAQDLIVEGYNNTQKKLEEQAQREVEIKASNPEAYANTKQTAAATQAAYGNTSGAADLLIESGNRAYTETGMELYGGKTLIDLNKAIETFSLSGASLADITSTALAALEKNGVFQYTDEEGKTQEFTDAASLEAFLSDNYESVTQKELELLQQIADNTNPNPDENVPEENTDTENQSTTDNNIEEPQQGFDTDENGGVTPTNDNTPGRPEGYVGEEDTSLTGPTNIIDKLKNLLGIDNLKTTTETTTDEAPEVTHETREVETEVITPEIEDQTATVNYEANMETPEAENLTGEIDYEANVETPEVPEVPDQTINVTADTSSADAALNGVKAEEDAIDSNKDVTITAHDNATGVLGTIVGLLNSVTDRSATVTTTYVEEHYGGPKAKGGTVTFQDRKKKFNGERHANGGTTGTNGLVGTWLGDEYNGSGEKKPELVVTPDGNAHLAGLNGWEFENLPKGTRVYSNKETKQLLGERHADGGFLGARLANGYNREYEDNPAAPDFGDRGNGNINGHDGGNGSNQSGSGNSNGNNNNHGNSGNSGNGAAVVAKTIEGYVEDIGDKLEEICKQFDTMLSVVEDSIDLLEYEEEKTDTPSEQHFKLLENKLDILNRYQAELEAQGATVENSSDYRDVLKQIAELMQDEINLRQKQYEHNRDVFEAERNQMEFQGRNDPDKYVNQMIASLKESRQSALEQAEYLMSQGYDENSDEVIDLIEEANGYSEDIEDVISESTERLIDSINKNFKDINTAYDTILWKANKEKEELDKQWAKEEAYYDIESERLAENDRQIDQLQKIQDAEKELAEVKDQRVRVMTANGYEWTTDPKALEQATKNRDDVYRTIERDNRDYNRAKQHKQDEIDLYKSYYGENWQGYEALADEGSMYSDTERIREEQEKQSHLQGEILLEAKYGNASTAEILSYMASDEELQKYNQEFFKNELANLIGDNFSEIEGVKEAVENGDISAVMDAILKDRGGYANLSTKEKAVFDEINNWRNYEISKTGKDVGMKVADASTYELSRGEDVKKAARRGIIESGLSEIRESGKEVTYKDVMNLINQAAKYGSNNNNISEGEIDLNSKAAQTLMNDKNYNVYNETQQLADKNAAAQNVTNETNQFTIQNLQVNADNANDLIVSLQNYTKTTAKLYTARR